MESLTKNRQSRETVQKIAEKFFPDDRMAEYEELTEGYFNVAYEITLLSGRSVILKVAPSDEVPVMFRSRWFMGMMTAGQSALPRISLWKN